MADLKRIYNEEAGNYEELVSHEDYEGNLLRAVSAIKPLDNLDVVDLGAGTGRVTRLLLPQIRRVHALDISSHMLSAAKVKLGETGFSNWSLGVADHRHLPLKDRTANLVISGWSISSVVVWYADTWRDEIQRVLSEIRRVLRPAGAVVIIETLGTGHQTPAPPDVLVPYYELLEQEGFISTWIRTDYKFDSVAESERLARFFFGDLLAEQVRKNQWAILPECTGIWWLRT